MVIGNKMNKLYFGDNLEILRNKIPSGCVDLIYLDPPCGPVHYRRAMGKTCGIF